MVGGVLAGSVALIGFGIEVDSAVVKVWRLTRTRSDRVGQVRAEQRAVRLTALSFYGIAAYVTLDVASTLVGRATTRNAARSALQSPRCPWW